MARKPGKYDHVIHALPRLLGKEPAYQLKVDAIKDAMVKEPDFLRHASWLAQAYVDIRDEKAAAQKVLGEIELRLEAISQLMADQFEVEAVSAINVDGRPVRTRLEPWAQVVNHDEFRNWCMRDPDLVRLMSLPWQTINKITKDRLLEGEPEPPGVTIYAKTRFTLGSE